MSAHRTPGRDGQALDRYNYLTWMMVATDHRSGQDSFGADEAWHLTGQRMLWSLGQQTMLPGAAVGAVVAVVDVADTFVVLVARRVPGLCYGSLERGTCSGEGLKVVSALGPSLSDSKLRVPPEVGWLTLLLQSYCRAPLLCYVWGEGIFWLGR